MALVNLEKVDKGKVKEMVKLLNPILDEKKMDRIKVVGIKPQAMADGFTVQVEALADANLTEELKAKAPAVIEFYNSLEFIEGGQSEWAAKEVPAAPPANPAAAAPAAAEGAPAAAEGAPAAEAAPAATKPPKPPKEKKPRGNAPKTGIMSKPASWEDLKKRLSTPQTPTAYMDHLTLKGGTLEDLVKEFQEWRAKNAPDYAVHFKSAGGLRAHIEYRKTKGWVYEEKENFVKLAGYNG